MRHALYIPTLFSYSVSGNHCLTRVNTNDNLKYSLQLTMDAALVNNIELKSVLINALAGHLQPT